MNERKNHLIIFSLTASLLYNILRPGKPVEIIFLSYVFVMCPYSLHNMCYKS